MRPMLLAVSVAATLGAQAPIPTPDPFAPVRFLVGDWRGEGDGKPGQSLGATSFRFELEGRVLVRRNVADSAGGKGKPAFHHEDLLSVFAEGGQLKALYLDNEDHVIRYLAAPVPGGVAFTSEPGPGPGFRLTYLKKTGGSLLVRFEFAQPGRPEAFATYLEGSLVMVK